MRGLPSILSLFRNELNKFNYVRFYLSDGIKNTLKSRFWRKNRYKFFVTVMNSTLNY